MTAGLRLLLVATGRAWITATDDALNRLGGGMVDRVTSGLQAVSRLISTDTAYSHVLVQPRCVQGLLPDIYALTDGEHGSATRLVVLGADGLPPALSVPVITDAVADLVLAALARAAPSWPTPPRWQHAELQEAISGPMVQARYQPVVRASDAVCVGLEVLARLHHPDHGWLRPAAFVIQAEAAGLATPLTESVIKRALAELSHPAIDNRQLTMALNFPLDVFIDPAIVACLDAQRSDLGFPARRIVVELVETSPVEDIPTLRSAVERLRGAGYGVAIDDFSPALPHQRALLDLPFTALKLDVEVVRGVHDPEGHAYVLRTISTAQRNGLTVTAEGVEDRHTWRVLEKLGVDHVQGFLVSRPLPHKALPAWLERWPDRRHELIH